MNISSAVFDRSAPDLASCPDESLPEFAFIGRSNVGKSSLLNMLAGERGLARVSRTPGFTKLINIFTVNKRWRLVDLPGYGFAHVARQDSARFNHAVIQYLEHRPNLSLVFALIESTSPPQKIDLEFVEWLVRHSVPFVLVFTKADKASPAAVEANVQAFADAIAPWFEKAPAMFTCSAGTRQGRPELLGIIDEMLAANTTRQVEAPPTREAAPAASARSLARQNAKTRPDRNRPW